MKAGFNLMKVRGDPDQNGLPYKMDPLLLGWGRGGSRGGLDNRLSVPYAETKIVFILTHTSFTSTHMAVAISSRIFLTSHFVFISSCLRS